MATVDHDQHSDHRTTAPSAARQVQPVPRQGEVAEPVGLVTGADQVP
jgi:hypothetical protein